MMRTADHHLVGRKHGEEVGAGITKEASTGEREVPSLIADAGLNSVGRGGGRCAVRRIKTVLDIKATTSIQSTLEGGAKTKVARVCVNV